MGKFSIKKNLIKIVAVVMCLGLVASCGMLHHNSAMVAGANDYTYMYCDGKLYVDHDYHMQANRIVCMNIKKYYGTDGLAIYENAKLTGDYAAFYNMIGKDNIPSSQSTKLMTNETGVDCSGYNSGAQYVEYILGLCGLTSVSDLLANSRAAGYADEDANQFAKDVYKGKAKITVKSSSSASANTSATVDSDFDSAFYGALYPDVVAAFGSSKTALWNHYVKYGKAEGRFKNATEYNTALAASNR